MPVRAAGFDRLISGYLRPLRFDQFAGNSETLLGLVSFLIEVITKDKNGHQVKKRMGEIRGKGGGTSMPSAV